LNDAIGVSERVRRLTPALVAGVLMWAAVAGTACAQDEVPWLLARAPKPVTNADALVPFLIGAETGRADVVCLGDSNQIHQSNGWDHGLTRAFGLRFGVYASALLSPGENAGNGSGMGYLCGTYATSFSNLFDYSRAPNPLDRLLDLNTGLTPLGYLYLPSGQAAGVGINLGMFIVRWAGLNIDSSLRFHVTFAMFPAGPTTGSFQLSVRDTAGFQTIATGSPVLTSWIGYGVSSTFLDIAAGTRGGDLDLRLSPIGSNLVGPVLFFYQRVEDRLAPTGVSVHTLYAQGGMSARDMLLALLNTTDDQLSLYFSKIRELQHGAGRTLVRINTGLNDRGETLASLGPVGGITPGSSVNAFEDNIRGIIERIEDIWRLNGWNLDELSFVIAPSHPINNPDDSVLRSYRARAEAIALSRENTAAVNYEALTAWNELVANDWYAQQGFDSNHLSESGFEALSVREVRALEAGRCWVDLTGDGAIDIQDLYRWYEASVDLDGDGMATNADIACLSKAIRYFERDDL
jgi:hypothetical protein